VLGDSLYQPNKKSLINVFIRELSLDYRISR